jgi:hypothetical protein
MQRFSPAKSLLLATIALASALVHNASADPLTLNVINPDRFVSLGSTETYLGTITNDTGQALQTADLFLDFAGYDPAHVSLTQLLGIPDTSIPTGATSPVLPLFDFNLASTSPAATYAADIVVQSLANDFSSAVTVRETVTPEPGSLLLLGMGLTAVFAGLLRRRKAAIPAVLIFFGVAGLTTPSVNAQSASPVNLITGTPGVTLESTGFLETALPIQNTGSATAEGVQITSVFISTGAVVTALPVSLGFINPDKSAPARLRFSGTFAAEQRYLVIVSGTYSVGPNTFGFSVNRAIVVPPSAPGFGTLATVPAAPNFAVNAPYPPQPPNFDNDTADGPGWVVPDGPFRPGVPTPTGTGTQPLQPILQGRLNNFTIRPADAPPVQFSINAGLGVNGSGTNEPSGGTGGSVVFVAHNWKASYSTNNGSTFTEIDPTTIFPNTADGGFCCDQIIQYAPSIDRFIWLMMFSNQTDAAGNRTTGNRLRIASASPADIINSGGTAWTYWDLTTGLFGLGTNQLDYPDMSLGNNSLYVSADNRFGTGLIVMRIPLSQIQASTTINIDYTDPTKSPQAFGGHLTQNTGDEIFWAGHNGPSQMRVFSLQEGSNTYFWRDRDIATWSGLNISSLTPDLQDWLNFIGTNFPGTAVLGSTRVFYDFGQFGRKNEVWFAWTAGTDSNFSQPHVEMVILDRDNDFSLKQQVQIWNSSYAYAYPALATNSDYQVGLSLEYGGGGNYENHVVGFWGDFVLYATTSSNVGSTRFGDYVTIRQNSPDPSLFAAFGYGLDTIPPPGGGTQSDTRYVLFGRPPPTPPK